MTGLFLDVVDSVAALEATMGAATERVRHKQRSKIDAQCRAFIARSPFVLVASADCAGRMDISPRGDPPGFVHVLDETTLAIPDRPGNRRADTFNNVLQRGRVALLFMIPGRGETLRANGSATIVRDRWLLAQMAVDSKEPALALAVTVEEIFFHCPKCIARSGLWDMQSWPQAASLGEIPRLANAEPLY